MLKQMSSDESELNTFLILFVYAYVESFPFKEFLSLLLTRTQLSNKVILYFIFWFFLVGLL